MLTRRTFLKTGGLATAGLAIGNLPVSVAADSASSSSAADPAGKELSFLTKPYLQHLTVQGVTVMWVVNRPCHNWVEYCEEGRQEGKKAVAVTRGLVESNNRINRIPLRPLKAGTAYRYQVCSQEIAQYGANSVTFGDTIRSEIYTFTTPLANEHSVSALIFNDLHDKGDTLIARMMALSAMPNFDFVFLNGDILNHTPDEERILRCLLVPCANAFATGKPFIAVRGNHETRNRFARNYFDYFQMGDDNAGYHSFVRGPVFFIALDSGEDKEDDHREYSGLSAFDGYREEQAVRLERQLQSKACREAPYRVVFMHIPPYPGHPGDWHGTQHCRKVFGPLFRRYGISMLICGHTHRYAVHPPCDEHPFPVIIGGGRETSTTTTTGNTTVIKLQANARKLNVEIIDYNGASVGAYTS
jgi:predicted phosphodiesterase